MECPRVGFFSRTIKASKQAGAWDLFHRTTLKEWFNADIGMRYTTTNNEGEPGWKVDGVTRTPYFRVRNRYGGESECMLYSLDYDDDIEDKIKEQEFSMLYFAELDKFKLRKVFSVSNARLRLGKMSQQMWLADTNPAEEGEDSWIHDVWYKERVMPYDEYLKYCQRRDIVPMEERVFKIWQDDLELIEMFPEDNQMLEAGRLDRLKADNSSDEELYARYVKGAWVWGFGDKSRHFKAAFKPSIHVVGNCSDVDTSKWEYANPSPACTELPTGWDLGDSNHAVVIAEVKTIGDKLHFVFLDEVEHIQEETSVEVVVAEVMEKITTLERISGRQFDLSRAWSDSSSLTKFNASSGTYQAIQVTAFSGGRIELQGVEKPEGSVRLRVQLLKQLLNQNRIQISAHCEGIQRMLKEFKRGKREFVDPQDKNKHIFDAMTYMLLKECAEEYASMVFMQSVGHREPLNLSI